MASYTTNLNLKKPAQGDPIRVADFNNNADTIDSTFGAIGNTSVASQLSTLSSKINSKTLTGGTPTKIPANSDLNNYKEPGVYYIETSADFASMTNTPALPSAGWQSRLIVFPSAGYSSGNITNGGQILWNNNGHIAYRTYTTSGGVGSFNAWQLISSSISRVKVTKSITISSAGGYTKMCDYTDIDADLAFSKILSVDFFGWVEDGLRQVQAYSDGIYIYSTKAITNKNVQVLVTYTKNGILVDSDVTL